MKFSNQDLVTAQRTLKTMAFAVFTVGMLASGGAIAQGTNNYGGTELKVCGFFDSINGLLSMASIAVVTIAVIFSGYQIAFAHKRIGDVAPILIGGVLIGGAGQIATMVIGTDGEQCRTSGTLLIHASQYFNA
ncbi:type IV secretion system protein VirB2 [Xanthomonas campestris]